MKKEERIELYETALDKYGIKSQVFMVMEECGELLSALGKGNRGRLEGKMDVITELADVSIMVEQMAVYFGYDEYKKERERKLQRLAERLAEKC